MMTVRMLQEKMQTFMGSDSDSDEEAYSRKYMKQKLTEYYSNDIIFAKYLENRQRLPFKTK